MGHGPFPMYICTHTLTHAHIHTHILKSISFRSIRWCLYLPQSYYRDVDAVLMVFDMTDQDSLDEVEYRWAKQLQYHLTSADVPVLLVGNKVC